MSQKTQEFYTALLSRLKDIQSRREYYKKEVLHSRYRIRTESELYSVVIPVSSFGTKTVDIFVEQFEKNYSDDLPQKIDAHLDSNLWDPIELLLDGAPSWDLKSPETDIHFNYPSDYEPKDFSEVQFFKQTEAIQILQSIVLDEWKEHFLAVFEYRAPDGSLFYVLFNKEGIELVRTSPDFEPYPLSGAEVDLRKVYILPNEKTEYDSSFPDLRYRP